MNFVQLVLKALLVAACVLSASGALADDGRPRLPTNCARCTSTPLATTPRHFCSEYRDDPPESKALDNMGGANKGMFDVEGKPHRALLDGAAAINREVYPLIEFFDKRRRDEKNPDPDVKSQR